MRPPNRTRATSATAVVAFLCILTATAIALLSPQSNESTPSKSDQDHTRDLLTTIQQVSRRVHILGYRREFFGGWQTRVTDQGWRCTTREIVLFSAFGAPSPVPTGASTCPNATGSAIDVYTAHSVTPSEVQIDHIVPLAAAWDHGAHTWSREKRITFANDTARNLVAVSGRVNQEKSDGTPAEWLPPSKGSTACAYVARYLLVVSTYGLSISEEDANAARHACHL